MKKLVMSMAVVILLFLLSSVGISHAADGNVRLYLNRTEMKPEVPARIVEGNTLVPVRIISEGIGANVSWNQEKQRVTIEKDGLAILLTIDRKEASVNGVLHTLEVPPVLDSGNTMLPVRFVSENLGLNVQWDALTRAVFLFQENEGASGGEAGGGSSAASPDVSATPSPTVTIKPDPAQSPQPSSSQSPSPSATPNPGVSSQPSSGGSILPTPGVSAVPSPNITTKPSPGSAASSSPGSTDSPDGTTEKLPAIVGITLDKGTLSITADEGAIKPVISRLSNPERLIIDIPHAALGQTVNGKPAVQNGEILLENEFASRLRYALFQDKPSTVRVVVDLKQKIAYNLLESENPAAFSLSLRTFKYLVVLDAGHGDTDPGAGSKSGRKEKEFNLSMILKLAKQLQDDPYIAISLTRKDDTFIELDDRVKHANELGADLFVSIHGNSFTKDTISGTETYYSRDESRRLADVLHKRIVEAAGLSDRNVRKKDLRVTKGTVMPAVLCEIGYLSNLQDEQAMFNEDFQNRVAAAIAAGIREYLNVPKE